MGRLSEKEIMMSSRDIKEKLVFQKVTYTLFLDDQFYIIENVPARVDSETGEQYFSPKTVAHLQKIIQEKTQPMRTVQTPVYHFP